MRRHWALPKQITTKRDVGLVRIGKDQLLAVSCDAAGGIGSKPHDLVKAHPRMVGKLTARVALMELLAIGADPLMLAATLCVEPEPTGNQVMQGILEEVRHAELSNVQLVCSTEKNVKVDQTGIGVTAIGLALPSKLKIGRCKPGDVIVAIGEPHVGQEVLAGERNGKLADTCDVCRIRKKSVVHEIIPVGSKGILCEAQMLATGSKLSLNLDDSGIDVKKSAGPATVLLCALAKHSLDQAGYLAVGKPVRVIGGLVRR